MWLKAQLPGKTRWSVLQTLAQHGQHWCQRLRGTAPGRPANAMWRGVNFFILDSRRVLAPAPKVLGPKHISNPDFAPF